MIKLKPLTLALLLVSTCGGASAETATYKPQASLLAPPPGQETVGDGHGVAYDGEGNILVTEWNRWGRVLTFSWAD